MDQYSVSVQSSQMNDQRYSESRCGKCGNHASFNSLKKVDWKQERGPGMASQFTKDEAYKC